MITHEHPAFSRADFNAKRILSAGGDERRTILDNIIGSLNALGYSTESLQRISGMDHIPKVPVDTHVSSELLGQALALAAQIGDRLATPEATGLTISEIESQRAAATAAGYGTPAAYGPTYRLLSVARPEDAGMRRPPSEYGRDHLKISVLAGLLRGHHSAERIAGGLGTYVRFVHRVYARIGLRVINGAGGSAAMHLSHPAAGQEALVAMCQEAINNVASGADSGDEWTALVARVDAMRAAEQAATAARDAAEEATLGAA